MTLVFDAEPLLAYYLDEPAGAAVGALLRRVAEGRERGHISRVNLAEVSYKLARKDVQAAEGIVEGLVHHGLEPAPCGPVWEDAATLKARFAPLSLADAFAAATARWLRADLVVIGDEALQEACSAERIRLRRIG